MARKSKADLRLERQQLLKEYERRRKTIQETEASYRKAGGIITQISTPKLTAKQIEKSKIGIRQLRAEVEKLRDINYRVIRKRTEYTTDTGEKITISELFHRQASERAKRSAITRGLHRLTQLAKDNNERIKQHKQELEKTKISQHPELEDIIDIDELQHPENFDIKVEQLRKEEQDRAETTFNVEIAEAESKNNLMNVYIEALLDGDTEFAKTIARRWFNIYDTPITDEDLSKYSGAAIEEYLSELKDKPKVEYDEGIQGTDFNYNGTDYRTGEQYESYDLNGYLSYLDEITKRIEEGFYNTRGGMRVGRGRKGWTPYDFDEDKNDLLTMWKDTIDRYSNNDEDREDLINYIKAHNDRISLLIEAIEYDSELAIYQHHYAELYSILHYDAPTVEDLLDFGDMEDWEEL